MYKTKRNPHHRSPKTRDPSRQMLLKYIELSNTGEIDPSTPCKRPWETGSLAGLSSTVERDGNVRRRCLSFAYMIANGIFSSLFNFFLNEYAQTKLVSQHTNCKIDGFDYHDIFMSSTPQTNSLHPKINGTPL